MALVIAGCDGRQSALEPAGKAAEHVAELFWAMSVGAAIIWVGVIGLAVYSIHIAPQPHGRRAAVYIIGGGVVFPTVVLTGLLIYGLSMLPALIAPAPEGSPVVTVIGEQWWWRVRYQAPDGEAVELANEIRMPVGQPVGFELTSPDVIHAFWIPPLGGKMDMIPGRTTRLALHATRTGEFRGQCAEYCGTSHALMAFPVVVMEPDAFAAWLEHQAAAAASPTTPEAERGRALFLAAGCGACHAVRGTPADGVIGPDLPHVGSRLSLGAGTLPNDADAFVKWIAETETVKPDVHMPPFGMLARDELHDLAAYLESLE